MATIQTDFGDYELPPTVAARAGPFVAWNHWGEVVTPALSPLLRRYYRRIHREMMRRWLAHEI